MVHRLLNVAVILGALLGQTRVPFGVTENTVGAAVAELKLALVDFLRSGEFARLKTGSWKLAIRARALALAKFPRMPQLP